MSDIKAVLTAKIAPTDHDVHSLIRKRWSARAFTGASLTEEQVHTLIEAASWAPSSMNEQPWRYTFATSADTDKFKKFFDCLMPGNQAWAGTSGALVLSLAEKNFAKTGGSNRHAMHDTGAANMQLLLQATAMDIYGHVLGGFDPAKTKETFEIPDHLEIVAFIALGFLDEPSKLPEPFLSREKEPRKRKTLIELLY